MCTVILLIRPGHAWPVLIAANRDERIDRPWDPPGAFWPEQPGVVAGRDRLGGGTWMAMRGGLVAAVLNRPGSLGPAPGKLSRGRLPLLALRSDTAAAAVRAMLSLDGGDYRSFNMVIADRRSAWFVRGLGHGAPEGWALPAGLHVVTAHDPNDPASPRARAHQPLFAAAEAPDP
ncbi:MAG: NRDE family protein, partial [Gemmatimonadaceae bacterium]|nr:NRDE family protein [Acetobacteraceae bacterium]